MVRVCGKRSWRRGASAIVSGRDPASTRLANHWTHVLIQAKIWRLGYYIFVLLNVLILASFVENQVRLLRRDSRRRDPHSADRYSM